jgi:uncharacterized protein
VKLPRASGMREQRWAHLLCGPVDMHAADPGGTTARGSEANLSSRVESLEREMAQLRSALDNLCEQLGVSPLRQPEGNGPADN